ncbi:energy-coupling factor transporter transmembrane component T family protein [Geosporobacter ferrireducens]|uniref:Energy-coupling factor transporter transmembrane protein EcfT n=1 Tax=Geosporobacter ferrireducens TaxID=1424294 RepID=A0A1D8GJX2_9FIRM|nr:energy-coupling factor transporter transmembrane component T [Geosporobacter ferrireducens]AOT71200.1 transporter [Geosporobacter ferrireducens]MTI58013.1 energy-coupling factor transporter transmembrane protein EcfT [Geosporobacter ferrireducens]
MLRDITIGQYYPQESIIHRLDPRVKILATFVYIVALFLVKNFTAYGYILLFLGFSVLLSKVPFSYMIRGLKPLFLIIILTFAINVFMTKGEVIYQLGPLDITKEGIRQAVFMGTRLILLIIGTSLLTLTTSPIQLTDGIEKLLNPFKRFGMPAHELAMMMTIALRFIPTLLEETDKIMKAQMARGADFESGNIINRAKSLVPLLVPLFISAFRRADELAMAMEARCYRGGENRTRMKELALHGRDFIASLITLLMLAVVILDRLIM